MNFDEEGWIPLSVEMFERLEAHVGADCISSAKDSTFSGEPWAGALIVLGRIEETGGIVEIDFLDRLAEWFLHADDEPEDPFVEPLREVFGILRGRAINTIAQPIAV